MKSEKTIKVNLSQEDIEWIYSSLRIRHNQLKDEFKGSSMIFELKNLMDDMKNLMLKYEH